ncbi:flavodoxin family protein [Paenarthrobacter sp. RAF54_2]|uniref:flavodoxin family protein n=1 Tax=unclassified Paenarthrobacter TaxID=2634190 RepID=UPI003F94D773
MMDILVVYETMYGTTRRVAEAIASGFDGEPGARAVSVSDVVADDLGNCALLIVGGPTHAHGMSRPATRHSAANVAAATGSLGHDIDANVGIREWLAQLRPAIPGQKAAAFDTRNHGPAFLTGRASKHITSGLRKAGFELIAEPESFEVSQEPSISEDELHRAAKWGQALARLIDAGR